MTSENNNQTNSARIESEEAIGTVHGNEAITMEHLHHLKEYLALNQADMLWLTGMPMAAWYGHGGDISPTLAMMVRLYDMHPSLVPIPTYPTYEEMYNVISPFFVNRYGKKLAHTRMGTLFGVGKWAGYSWSKPDSKEQSPTRKRLFLAVYTMIERSKYEARIKEQYVEQQFKNKGIDIKFNDILTQYTNKKLEELGLQVDFKDIEKTRRKGFDDFLSVLTVEAKTRGYADLDDLFKRGWHNGDKKEEESAESGRKKTAALKKTA